MARIVIAGTSGTSREQLSRLLASSGFSVFRSCGSESELRRAINECEDGVAVLIGALPGCRPDELQWDYGDRMQFLLVGRPSLLESCESPEIFRLPLPVSAQAVIGAVQKLSRLHQMRLPKRASPDQQTVSRAKRLLMMQSGMTEPEAHRALQRYAMNHGMKMSDYAVQVIRHAEDRANASPADPLYHDEAGE